VRLKPSYIARARVDDATARYVWDEWKGSKYCEPIEDEFLDRYAQLVPEAMIAMTDRRGRVADAEVRQAVRRPGSLSVPRVCVVREYRHEVFVANRVTQRAMVGPVRRPMWIGIVLTNHLLYEMEEIAEGIKQPAHMSRRLEPVLTVPTPFRQWRDQALDLSLEFYTRGQHDPFEDLFEGRPREPILVPRELRPLTICSWIGFCLESIPCQTCFERRRT
jgi:hypothetical protein